MALPLKEAKLVTYTSLCRPILDLGWDPATRSKVPNIELVQNCTIWFISNLKGRNDSASEERKELGLHKLKDMKE